MIYIKIYLDKDENGEDMLVFDSVKHDDKKAFFTVAGEKEKFSYLSQDFPWFDYKTKVIGVEQVAISPEAKELFLEMLNDESVCKHDLYSPHFDIRGYRQGQYGWDTGMFAFVPDNIANGGTKRTLRRGENFTRSYGDEKNAFEYMVTCDNEVLKNLALDEPADETSLLDAYYAAKTAKGEELACDADTICKTPFRYLTEAQKELIKNDYRRMVDCYDAQEWHDNGEFLDDKIMSELAMKYFKSIGALNIIIGRRI